jgi:prepilin-type N-terminal cleavage/methylation domain-containing protein
MKINVSKSLKLSLARTVNSMASGFTLIELLVVVAIIGLLSTVVLFAVSDARNKGADAAVKENLINARTQAEIFYNANLDSYYTDLGYEVNDVCAQNASVTLASKSIYPFLNEARRASGADDITRVEYQSTEYPEGGSFTTVNCSSTGSTWMADAPLKKLQGNGSPWMFCVDSSGNAKEEATAIITSSNNTGCR